MLRILLILFLIGLKINSILAQDATIIQSSDSAYYNLNKTTYFLIDSSNLLTYNDIIKSEFQKKFKCVENNVGNNSYSIWCKIRIVNNHTSNNDWELYVGNNAMIEVYLPAKNTIKYYKGGLLFPNESLFRKRYNSVAIKLDKSDSIQDIYVKLKNFGNNYYFYFQLIPLKNILYETIYNFKFRINYFIIGGICLIMFLFHFIYFLAFRDKIYLYYSLYILSYFFSFVPVIFYYYFETGIHNVTGQVLTIIFNNLVIVFFIQFTRLFIHSKKIVPKLDEIFKYDIFLKILLIFIVFSIFFIGVDIHKCFLLINIFLLIDVLLITISVPIIYKVGDSYAKIFSFGMFLLYIFSFIGIYHLIKQNLALSHPFLHLGVILQILVLSLGLGHKARQTEKEKVMAQNKLIEQLKENELLQTKVNRELEEKVKERTAEIEKQKEEILEKSEEIIRQNEEINKRNTEIISSINYARRIQNAILPSVDTMNSFLPKHFIFYCPKDIVSGDFYWIKVINNKLILCAADCTGHGVPGAFMSVLGITLLNEIANSCNNVLASSILNELRKGIKTALNQRGIIGESQDGMDISLCVIDLNTKQLNFAGAHNSLYVISKNTVLNTKELNIYKADRMPIGIYRKEGIFTDYFIDYSEYNTFYLFSDGIHDQVGGENSQKFKSERLRNLFLESSEYEINKQDTYISKVLTDWMKSNEQIDDMLILGFQL